jgi:rRNA maturation protein Rpf1
VIQTLVEKSFILLTTSRRPVKNTRTFCRDLSNTFPNVVRINRGKLNLGGVAEKALELNAEKAIIIGKWRGDSGKIQFFRTSAQGLDVIPPLIYVKGVKLRRDFEENAPRGRRLKSVAITASKISSLEVKRLENVLSEFFNIPILSLKEICDKKFDAAMRISADPSNRTIVTFRLIPEFVEVGPQIRISHLVWELNR